MKIGDLVRLKKGYPAIGIVMKIDKQHYGARQAFKVSKVERGKALRPGMVDIIAPTRDGIQDRVMVLWTEDMEQSYENSIVLEVLDKEK
jgi:hypothetical protein